MAKYYTASKSRNKGRDAWSVIFRHPVRHDPSTGKPGRRIRRGLGTADDAAADALVAELNELLQTPALWEPSARSLAADRFDPLVIDIFYGGSEASETDFRAIRDEWVPLPGADQDYRSVLLLGTTGAGKTTLVRQVLGTDPRTERFPSTSTAKTTVADTEIVLTGSGPFSAAVTFTPRDEVVDYLTENVAEAALAAFHGKDDVDVLRRLLDHVNQRFRFSYVLGRPKSLTPGASDDDLDDDLDEDIDEEGEAELDLGDYGEIDVDATARVLEGAVSAIREVVQSHADHVRADLSPDEEDERVVEELIEENLDHELRQSEEFHRVVDALLDEIELRFATLTVGELRHNRQGWPVSWTWTTEDRAAFLKTISRFTSNHAPLFGRLLTPLVNGIRVAGPFETPWTDEAPRLVLIDGEGLGHTPKSAATLSTAVAKRIEEVDAVLLVDSATQPMQAAPVAAMKAVAISGNGSKLHVLFTHLDQVTGDNLPTFSAKEEHVLASAENVLKAIGDEVGPAAERILRQRLERARYFVGGIQEELDPERKAARRAIGELTRLVGALASDEERIKAGPSKPVFDRMNLSLAVAEAAKSFHSKWEGLLGLAPNPTSPKEHWTRVKALSRRLAEGWADEYDTLKPVADLRDGLQSQIYLMLQRPVRWEGGEPDDDAKQVIIDDTANAITKRLFALTQERIKDDSRLAWQAAYAERGTGSTFRRARIISADVYDRAAPVPTVTASPDQNRFLKAVAAIVAEVADEMELILE